MPFRPSHPAYWDVDIAPRFLGCGHWSTFHASWSPLLGPEKLTTRMSIAHLDINAGPVGTYEDLTHPPLSPNTYRTPNFGVSLDTVQSSTLDTKRPEMIVSRVGALEPAF